MENTKRIVVADTGTEFRKNLIRALLDEPDFQIVGETGDGTELMRMVQKDQPDAVIWTWCSQAAWTVWTCWMHSPACRTGLRC